MARAERLCREPLQQVLIFVGLFEELYAGRAEPPEGCLYAAYAYQRGQFDADTLAIAANALSEWRRRLAAKLTEVAAVHPPRLPVDAETLADAFMALFQGAVVIARTLGDPGVPARQFAHYRNYLELLFASAPEPR